MSQYASYPSLKDRSVFITGGGSRHRRLAGPPLRRAGLEGRLRRHRASTPSRQLVDEIAAAGRPAGLCSSPATCATSRRCGARSPRSAAAHGPITVLVNNAAHDERHKFDTVTPEYWDDRMAVNLQPPVLRRPGGPADDEGGGRRLDRQLRLGQLDDRPGRHARLHRRQGRGHGPDPRRSRATSARTTSGSTRSRPAGS